MIKSMTYVCLIKLVGMQQSKNHHAAISIDSFYHSKNISTTARHSKRVFDGVGWLVGWLVKKKCIFKQQKIIHHDEKKQFVCK